MYYKQFDAVKSVGTRKVQGQGVRFGSPETKDWDGEFFIPDTELGLVNGANRPAILEHGFGKTFGVSKIADVVYEKTAIDWAYEATFLDTKIGNDAYNEVISKPYRSSAGAAGHTRRATLVKGAYQLDTWMIAEQSFTLTPSDNENQRIVRTKSDYLLFAMREMLDEIQTANEAQVKSVIEQFVKDSNESRQRLADALTSFRSRFDEGSSSGDFVLSEDFLAAFERETSPIAITVMSTVVPN